MVDRVINVPLTDEQVMKTVTTLPRSLDDGFVVPIQFKRLKEMKNTVMAGLVRSKGLIDALQTLKNLGNPHYQNINIDFGYCEKSSDDQTEESKEPNLIRDEPNDEDDNSEEEDEGPIKRFQTSSASDVTCVIPKTPHIDVVINNSPLPRAVSKLDSSDSELSEPYIMAPGQGICSQVEDMDYFMTGKIK